MASNQELILKWAKDKGILDKSTATAQLGKLREEVGELEEEVLRGRISDAMLELGDVLVVSTLIAHFLGTDIDECMGLAHAKISKRTGRMENGVFVKDSPPALLEDYIKQYYSKSKWDAGEGTNLAYGAQARFADHIGRAYQVVQQWVRYKYTVENSCIVKPVKAGMAVVYELPPPPPKS